MKKKIKFIKNPPRNFLDHDKRIILYTIQTEYIIIINNSLGEISVGDGGMRSKPHDQTSG